MHQESVRVRKVSRIALVVVKIVQAVLILSIGMSLLTCILPGGFFMPRVDKQGDFFYITFLNIITSAMVLVVLFVASSLLRSIKSDDTPFISKNTKRLKIISFLLVAIEPIQMILGAIFNVIRPLTENGEKIISVTSMGGMVIILGLIVFCIALVFERGIELQKQSDETL